MRSQLPEETTIKILIADDSKNSRKKYQNISVQVWRVMVFVLFETCSCRVCTQIWPTSVLWIVGYRHHIHIFMMYVYGGKWRAGANLVGVFNDIFYSSFTCQGRCSVGSRSRLENCIRDNIIYMYVILYKLYIIILNYNYRDDNITMIFCKIKVTKK